jgi:WD40 repeat protein
VRTAKSESGIYKTAQMLRSFEGNAQGASQVCALSNLPCGLLLSQDGRWLFFGDSKGGVHVWDSITGDVRFETELGHYISTAALSRDGAILAVAATGEPAEVFDLESKRLLFQLSSDFGGPMALAFSPDGSLIASGDTVLLDGNNGKAVRSYSKQKDIVRYLEASPDGSAVAVVYFNENGSKIPAAVMVFDIKSGDVLSRWTPDVPIIGGGWISNGHLLVATATEHDLQIRSLP